MNYGGKEPLKISHAFGHVSRITGEIKHIPVAARLTLPLIENTQDEIIAIGACERDNLTVRWLGRERLMGRVFVS